MADIFIIESIHGILKIAVCSHKMLLRLFPLIALAKKSEILKIIFRNEKDDEMDLEVNMKPVTEMGLPLYLSICLFIISDPLSSIPLGSPTDRVF